MKLHTIPGKNVNNLFKGDLRGQQLPSSMNQSSLQALIATSPDPISA